MLFRVFWLFLVGLRLPWVPLLSGLSGPLGPWVLGSMYSRRHAFPQVVQCRPTHTENEAQRGVPNTAHQKLLFGTPNLKGVGIVQSQIKLAQVTQETIGMRAILEMH